LNPLKLYCYSKAPSHDEGQLNRISNNLAENNTHKSKVNKVFIDVSAHRFTADIIKRHSTNQNDIREVALKELDLSGCRNILELGCGFGFFTEALKGKVHPEAVVTGVDIIEEYETFFLEACKKAGMKGRFCSEGSSVVNKIEGNSFDLIICSYSLYFFPEILPDISRVLRERGVFIATVHNKQNMEELGNFAKEILISNGLLNRDEKLPIEIFVNSFSSEIGHQLLPPWFKNVKAITFPNFLVFEPIDMYSLLEYFRFKWPFLFTSTPAKLGRVFDLFEMNLQKYFNSPSKNFTISKDDTIFICSQPLHNKKSR